MADGPLLCDLDGTIVDTAPAIFASLRVACDHVGVEISGDADLAFALGPPLHLSLHRLGVAADRMAEAIERFEDAHTERLGLVEPMPGAAEVLGELDRAGVAIGVATIKPQPIADLVLSTVGLRGLISSVHGRSDDLDPRTKTDLLRAVRADLDGDGPLYVGDHDNDAEAAEALGISFLRYPDHSWDDIRAAVALSTHQPDRADA